MTDLSREEHELLVDRIEKPITEIDALTGGGCHADDGRDASDDAAVSAATHAMWIMRSWAVTLIQPLMPIEHRTWVRSQVLASLRGGPDDVLLFLSGFISSVAQSLNASDPWRNLSTTWDLAVLGSSRSPIRTSRYAPAATGAYLPNGKLFGLAEHGFDLWPGPAVVDCPMTVTLNQGLTRLQSALLGLAPDRHDLAAALDDFRLTLEGRIEEQPARAVILWESVEQVARWLVWRHQMCARSGHDYFLESLSDRWAAIAVGVASRTEAVPSDLWSEFSAYQVSDDDWRDLTGGEPGSPTPPYPFLPR